MTKEDLMNLAMKIDKDIKVIDTAIPMHLWDLLDTQYSGYAYYKDNTHKPINLLELAFMEWYNNFITLDVFAEYYNISINDANEIYELAKREGY